MSEEKSLALADAQPKAISAFGGNVADFETGQRMARALAESDIVPTQYKGKLSNCLVALEVAHRTGSSVLAVMQNLNIIHGKPSWSAQYIIAAVNASGRYTPLRFTIEPKESLTVAGQKVQNLECHATATDKKTGEVLKGPPVSIETAVKEGWYQKAGSKWPAMPELMLQYRAATFFGRLYCPELLLGMQSEDEMRDVSVAQEKPVVVDGVNERIRARKQKAEASPDIVVEAKAVEEEPAIDDKAKGEGFY
jgi:hypothetical protein